MSSQRASQEYRKLVCIGPHLRRIFKPQGRMHTPEVVRCNIAVVIVRAKGRLEMDCPTSSLSEHD